MQFDSFPFEIRRNHLWPFVYGRPPKSSKLDYVDRKTSISNSSICKADAACVTESITNGKGKKLPGVARTVPVCLHPVKRADGASRVCVCVCVWPDTREQRVLAYISIFRMRTGYVLAKSFRW